MLGRFLLPKIVYPPLYFGAWAAALCLIGYGVIQFFQAAESNEQNSGVQNKTSNYNSKADRWSLLVEHDEDLRQAADQIRPYGEKYETDLRDKYFTLNDKAYLSKIVASIISTAQADAAKFSGPGALRATGDNLFKQVFWRAGAYVAELHDGTAVTWIDGVERRFRSISNLRLTLKDYGPWQDVASPDELQAFYLHAANLIKEISLNQSK